MNKSEKWKMKFIENLLKEVKHYELKEAELGIVPFNEHDVEVWGAGIIRGRFQALKLVINAIENGEVELLNIGLITTDR
ncbi:hypothetical protein [Methylophaga sp. OBS4]|uniref:hypothetical protein n=1 Tax=Methylophaga sp. OBS4 TaxID=2991935 RepID=UPI0022539E04|nr:hypothetical protein [Methylophaga sp. OBS4]MCX4187153.1 hypothetical protein [Methylophaga sp. OBS4]